jgi:colicin import membrane protein
MSDRSPSAFILSLTLHGAVVAIALFFTFALNQRPKDAPKIFELVAGAGDNYMATEAPALGVPGGVKLSLPEPTRPQVSQPAPEVVPVATMPEPSPIVPAPVEKPAPPPPKAPTKPAEKSIPDFKNQIIKKVIRAESQAKREIKKEQEKAAKISKEAFDKANKAAAAAAAKGGSPTKVAKIDTEGIKEGVTGGSTANKQRGAGGKALVAEDGSQLERYFSLLKARLKENHEKPSGLSDTLVARVEFFVSADGAISKVRIIRSSGSEEFDRSVREALARTKSIGPRPDKKGEVVELEFKMREDDSG